MDEKGFVRDFRPFRGKYAKQLPVSSEEYLFSGFKYEWRTISRYLKEKYVAEAIAGRIVVGWYTKLNPNVVGVDIDDHQGKAWAGVEASPLLLSLYDQVRQRMPEPSLLVQSPRGLHLYWLLTDRIPANILQGLAAEKLKNIKCEIRPTPDLSLRIPEASRILDTNTLLPQTREKLYRYHPAILFDDRFLPESIRSTLKDRKTRARGLLYSPKIEAAEALHSPFIPGETNNALNALVPVYKYAGLTIEDAIYRICVILQRSYLYDGELRDPRRLEQRVRSYYKRDYSFILPTPRIQQLNLLHKPLVDELVSQSPFAKQRDKPIERFLYSILNWTEWHDEIIQDAKKTAYFDYLYPWYRKNRRAGFYPLPSAVLRKANFDYFNLMPWLQETGFLTEAPFKYKPGYGICKYYKVRKD